MPDGGSYRSDEYERLRLELTEHADRAWLLGNGQLCIAMVEWIYDLLDELHEGRRNSILH